MSSLTDGQKFELKMIQEDVKHLLNPIFGKLSYAQQLAVECLQRHVELLVKADKN